MSENRAVTADHLGRPRQLPASAVGVSHGTAVLSLSSVSKTFPGTVALHDASLEIGREIHALVGQNGSGKSTLVKILAGYHYADPGAWAELNGEPFDITSARPGRHDRLRFVHQELGLVLQLSAVENLALARGFYRTRLGTVNWRQEVAATAAVLDRFRLTLDPERPLSEASPVERTVVAIAGALQGWEGGPGVLVLDEPTAVMPPREVGRLFEVIEDVRNAGTSVLYVSHRLDETFAIADRVSVLRGGRIVATNDVADITAHELASEMAGREIDPELGIAAPRTDRTPVTLEVRGLRSSRLRGVGLTLHEGEILGIAGIAGSGAEQIPPALAGAEAEHVEGQMRLPGEDDQWLEVRRAQSLRLPLVPADRARHGVVAQLSVAENLSLAVLDTVRRRGHLAADRERELVKRWIERLEVRTASPDSAIATLSGGNQQKVVMARCLAQRRPILLLCEPTAGVDIATRLSLYALISEEAEQGLSVLVWSSDVAELVGLCSRVLILRDGLVAAELRGRQLSRAAVVHAMEGTAHPVTAPSVDE